MKPALLQFEEEYAVKVKVVKVDISNPSGEDYQKYGDFYKSFGIPYFVLINKERKILKKHMGGMTKKDLIDFVGK